ncbi:hypothetical protein NLX67_17025 [Domibacillus sp. A3M-37]|uniref:hypothetical protein n=1 Tax=Domibacillus sp. A3M-37 TaxID=2962037 RepID=UPI0020B71212|nr:hypothetical protein [Domibacillus sp. A3M-37]MCP3764058.1 hypothetical protein [Domibacillus sp. A3M-37]
MKKRVSYDNTARHLAMQFTVACYKPFKKIETRNRLEICRKNEIEVKNMSIFADNISSLEEYNYQERRETAEDYDMGELDDLDAEEVREIDAVPGDPVKVYETAEVIAKLNASPYIDNEDKKALLKKLQKDEIKFKVDTTFDEVVEDLEEYTLF